MDIAGPTSGNQIVLPNNHYRHDSQQVNLQNNQNFEFAVNPCFF